MAVGPVNHVLTVGNVHCLIVCPVMSTLGCHMH